MNTRSWMKAHSQLLLAGVACEVVYALVFVRQYPLLRYYSGPYIDLGYITNHSHSGFWSFMAAFALLFGLVAVAWREVEGRLDRSALWIILGFGALFGI